ncbi:MAG: hypothetical protein R8L58_04420 [Mariprofundaceae bacterium]
MNYIYVLTLTLSLMLPALGQAADSCRLSYGWKPGETWQATILSQTQASYMGNASNMKGKQQITYHISEAGKAGWVHVEARIRNKAMEDEGGMDLSKLLYSADMHRSGQLKHVKYTGSLAPPVPDGVPEQMAAMMAQSYDMTAKTMQQGVFWFPELPEEKLELGDGFESVQKSGVDIPGMMKMQTVTKLEYTLEDIDHGLAYFSIRERMSSRVGGLGRNETKMAGKADAVFDLQQGMWVEMTHKSRIASSMNGGTGGQPAMSIARYRMELR